MKKIDNWKQERSKNYWMEIASIIIASIIIGLIKSLLDSLPIHHIITTLIQIGLVALVVVAINLKMVKKKAIYQILSSVEILLEDQMKIDDYTVNSMIKGANKFTKLTGHPCILTPMLYLNGDIEYKDTYEISKLVECAQLWVVIGGNMYHMGDCKKWKVTK